MRSEEKVESNQNNQIMTKLCVAYRGYQNGTVEFFGDQISELTGYDKDEFNSRKLKWKDLILEEYHEHMRNTFVKALKTNRVFQRVYKIKTKFNREIWIQEWGQIVCDDDGNIDFVLGILLDITEGKKIEETRLKCEALTGEYLLFHMDDDEYGIDINNVAQVIDAVPATAVPGRSDYVKGIITLHGKTITVIDLRMRLDIIPKDHLDPANIIIVESENGGNTVGLLVDSVSRVLHIDGEEILDPPKLLVNPKDSYILGIAKVENTLKLLIDAHELLTSLEADISET